MSFNDGIRQRKRPHGYFVPAILTGNDTPVCWGYEEVPTCDETTSDRLVLLECELSDFNDDHDNDETTNQFDARTTKTRPLANNEMLSRKPNEWPLSLLFEVYEKTMKASMLTREEFAFWEEKDPERRKLLVSILDKKGSVLRALHVCLLKRKEDASIFLKRMEREDRIFMAIVAWSAELLLEGDADPGNLCVWFEVGTRLIREPKIETSKSTIKLSTDLAIAFVSMHRYSLICMETNKNGLKLSNNPNKGVITSGYLTTASIVTEHLLEQYGPKNPKVAKDVAEMILASFNGKTLGTLFSSHSPSLFRKLFALETEESTLVKNIVDVMKTSDDVASVPWRVAHLDFFIRVAELYTDEPPDEWSFKAAGGVLFHALCNSEEETNDEFRRFHLAFRKSITLTQPIAVDSKNKKVPPRTICDVALTENKIPFLRHIVQFCEADFGSSADILRSVKSHEAFDVLFVNRSWFREAVTMPFILRVLEEKSANGTIETLHEFVLYFYRNNKVFQDALGTKIGPTTIFNKKAMRLPNYSTEKYEKLTWGQYCKAILKSKSKSAMCDVQ
jgi:hypothetical protein